MKQLAPSARQPGVYGRLALRLRRMVHEEHVNALSGAELFTVRHAAPLRIEALSSDLVLEDGDPDFTVGGWMRQFMLNYTLQVGDQVWVLREGAQWHLVDIADPGSQTPWSSSP